MLDADANALSLAHATEQIVDYRFAQSMKQR
jgi:hypothetical protein